MSDADAAAFTAALRETWPRIRFLRYHYWEENQTRDGTPPALRIPYVDGPTTQPGMIMIRAWVEPVGWRPRWRGPNEEGYHFIDNEPRLGFTWTPSFLQPPSRPGGHWVMLDGRIMSEYRLEDKEHAAFLRKVWRILERFVTNKAELIRNDRLKGRVNGPYLLDILWLGHDALRWAREDPTHEFESGVRPYDPDIAWP